MRDGKNCQPIYHFATLLRSHPVFEHCCYNQIMERLRRSARLPQTQNGQRNSGPRKRLTLSTILFTVVMLILPFALLLAMSPDSPLNELLQRINLFGYARLLTRFGGQGTTDGLFTDPRAIAVDEQGFVYVADYKDGRIQRFDLQGKFQNAWVAAPGSENSPVHVSSLAVDRDGHLYAAVGGKLLVYDGVQGQKIREIVVNVPGQIGPVSVSQVYLDSEGQLYLLYDGENILILNQSGTIRRSIPKALESVTGRSEYTGRLAVDGSGGVYLGGMSNPAIVKYGADGAYAYSFGSKGIKPGQFTEVEAVAVDPLGQVFVSDLRGINVFGADGRFLRRFGIGTLVYGMTFDAQGNLWVTTVMGQVAQYSLKK